MMAAIITLSNVTKRLPIAKTSVEVLHRVSLTINQGGLWRLQARLGLVNQH